MTSDPPLDEVQWRAPALAAQMGGIHTNTVLPYFAESPFFDRTSNNAVVTSQALYNPAMLYLVQTRAAFERHLASMSGLEFVVAHDPSRGDTRPDHAGAWVVRRQTRRKRPGGAPDEVVPLAAYFVVGESVYQAPSVAGVLTGRLLATVDSLNKLVGTLAPLPLFAPGLGHSYTAPRPAAGASGAPGSAAGTTASVASTPRPADAQSIASLPTTRAPGRSQEARETRLLTESLSLLQRFGHEFMDENPLVGEPGNFVVQKAKEGSARPVGRAGSGKEGPGEDDRDKAREGTPEGARAAAPPPPPPPIKTDLASEVHKKVKGMDKSPLTPGGGKRRKKKVQTPKTPK